MVLQDITRPPAESVHSPADPATSSTNAATIASAVPASTSAPAPVTQSTPSSIVDPDSGPKSALQAWEPTREIITDLTDHELDELYAQVLKSRETLGESEHARRFGEMERAFGAEWERRRKLAAAAAARRSGGPEQVVTETMTAIAAATSPQASSSSTTTVASGPAVTTFKTEPSHDVDSTAGADRSLADTRTVTESMRVDAAEGTGTGSPALDAAAAAGTVTAVATERLLDKVRTSPMRSLQFGLHTPCLPYS